MKLSETYFDKRIQKDQAIPDTVYATGLLRLLQFLFCDMNDFLEKEGRRFGIVLSYLNSIYQTYQKINFQEDLEIYNRILFLYRPVVLREYKRLCKRKVSEADSVIVIAKNILDLILEIPEYQYNKEARTLEKIITKLFDNIRNKSKNIELGLLMGLLRRYIEIGAIGKYSLDHISLQEEEIKKIRTPLEGSGIRLDEESDNKITEIVWKDE